MCKDRILKCIHKLVCVINKNRHGNVMIRAGIVLVYTAFCLDTLHASDFSHGTCLGCLHIDTYGTPIFRMTALESYLYMKARISCEASFICESVKRQTKVFFEI